MKECILAVVLLLLMALPGRQDSPSPQDPRVALVSIDIRGVSFRQGAPGENQPLESAIQDDTQLEHLQAFLDILQKESVFRFEIIGHTDNTECAGSDCLALSLRRSRIVHAWLLAKGADPAAFVKVSGYGAERPIDDNASEETRSRNRRVEFNPVIERDTK